MPKLFIIIIRLALGRCWHALGQNPKLPHGGSLETLESSSCCGKGKIPLEEGCFLICVHITKHLPSPKHISIAVYTYKGIIFPTSHKQPFTCWFIFTCKWHILHVIVAWLNEPMAIVGHMKIHSFKHPPLVKLRLIKLQAMGTRDCDNSIWKTNNYVVYLKFLCHWKKHVILHIVVHMTFHVVASVICHIMHIPSNICKIVYVGRQWIVWTTLDCMSNIFISHVVFYNGFNCLKYCIHRYFPSKKHTSHFDYFFHILIVSKLHSSYVYE